MTATVDSALASAGVDRQAFEAQADSIEKNDSDVVEMIRQAEQDGELSEQEQDDIGAVVADKALDKMGAKAQFDQLSADERMALADFCGNCLDGLANQAADEAAGSVEPANAGDAS
jgi:hypothetical protein